MGVLENFFEYFVYRTSISIASFFVLVNIFFISLLIGWIIKLFLITLNLIILRLNGVETSG